jgi:threonine/homoserine/homoserine lactone efflux protein
MDPQAWFLYLLASIGLALSPGPNGLLALTHGALHGPRRAMWTAAGGCTGFVVLIGASLFGIGALLQATPAALAALKWIGGAYLVVLGVQVWRAPAPGVGLPGVGSPLAGTALFRQALLTALSNPKALLFFLAFLPQFMDPAASLLLQFLVMAGTYAVVEFAFEVGLAAAAHRVSPWLQRSGRRFNQACGAVFVLIGAGLPLRG